jgi:hypothetical protein
MKTGIHVAETKPVGAHADGRRPDRVAVGMQAHRLGVAPQQRGRGREHREHGRAQDQVGAAPAEIGDGQLGEGR